MLPPPTRRQPLIISLTAFSVVEATWLLGRGYALAGSAHPSGSFPHGVMWRAPPLGSIHDDMMVGA
jgi:hypothetical protein